jgi:hypothetical protein
MMKIHLLMGVLWAATFSRAEATQFTQARLNLLDQRGYFTPGFKKAVHDLVNARDALERSHAEVKKLNDGVPALQAQSDAAIAQVTRLRTELALYTHPENSDFEALQQAMKDPGVPPKERLVLAQAFVWTYPTDPRQTEAAADLQETQNAIAAQIKAAADTDAARRAARAALIRRAKERSLSLAEWRSFLQDMSQEDMLQYLGRPQTESGNYWIYSGVWTTNPATNRGAGLRVNFNGTRELSVTPEEEP